MSTKTLILSQRFRLMATLSARVASAAAKAHRITGKLLSCLRELGSSRHAAHLDVLDTVNVS